MNFLLGRELGVGWLQINARFAKRQRYHDARLRFDVCFKLWNCLVHGESKEALQVRQGLPWSSQGSVSQVAQDPPQVGSARRRARNPLTVVLTMA